MANRRMLGGAGDDMDGRGEPGAGLATPPTLFDVPDTYGGMPPAAETSRRQLTQGDEAMEPMPQYIPPATMGLLFQDLRRR